jgi:hypothetical protein
MEDWKFHLNQGYSDRQAIQGLFTGRDSESSDDHEDFKRGWGYQQQ